MKRLLFIISCLVFVITSKAHAPSFSTPNAAGVTLHYNIIDATKRYVELTNKKGGILASGSEYTETTIIVPATVVNPNDGQTYTVKRIGDWALHGSLVKHFEMPTTVEEIGLRSFRQVNLQNQLVFHEGLRNVGSESFDNVSYGPGSDLTLTLPSTCDSIGWMNFAHAFTTGTVDLSRCSKLKYIVGLAFHRGSIHTLKLPEGLLVIGERTFDNNKLVSLDIPSTVKKIEVGAFASNPTLKEVNLRKLSIVPLTTSPVYAGHRAPFEDAHPDLKIYVNTDQAALYTTDQVWKQHAGHYVETVNIGATGYTSYYLENENFEIPTGCTAYIITGITPSGSATTPDQAVVKAFGAGKIIPKQTGFVLQGTPNSTVEYKAAVTGTEESVTGNLLVGTAVEREFSSTGKRYYVLANGDEGIGFYKQGSRGGSSIKLKAHRAGLCLATSVAPAKGFVVDFDAARLQTETTDIHKVSPEVKKADDVVYDLQGRRVTNPTRGIYIINGKKVIK